MVLSETADGIEDLVLRKAPVPGRDGEAGTLELDHVRVVYGWVYHCPVSGHRGHLLQDIVHRPPPAERLAVAGRVKSQSSDELTVFGNDADVRTGDEEADLRRFKHRQGASGLVVMLNATGFFERRYACSPSRPLPARVLAWTPTPVSYNLAPLRAGHTSSTTERTSVRTAHSMTSIA
jgi:hypothetical protein